MGENINWNDVKSVIIDGNKVTDFSISSSSIGECPTFEISGIYSPETLIMDTATTLRHDEIKNKIKEMEKEKGDNMEKINNILNLYKTYQLKNIDIEKDSDIDFIRKTSQIGQLAEKLQKQAEKELKKLYPDRENAQKLISIFFENTDETQEAIEKIIEDRNNQIENLERKLDDIKALIAIAETFEQKMEILRKYEVIDEDGKIKSW